MMTSGTMFTFGSLLGLFIPLVTITYGFSLYNLYIGRHVLKHKYILLALNFMFLFIYIMGLFTITDYNQVPLILLLVILLTIIVLGIIGGFMYDPNTRINHIDKFAKVTKRFVLIVKGSYIIVGSFILVFTMFQLLTHEIKVSNRVEFHYANTNNVPDTLDGYLSGSIDDEVTLVLKGLDLYYDIQDISKVEIFINDTLIHASVEAEGFLLDETYNSASIEIMTEQPTQGFLLHYTFDYDFDSFHAYPTDIDIKIVITTLESSYAYMYLDVEYSIGYETRIVQIWVKA